jgi:hypothetical protein
MSGPLPRMWSGVAFVGKFWTPVLLLGSSLLIAIPIRDLASILYFVALVVPLASLGLYYLLVPVQLRVGESTASFRRWFRWSTLRLDEISSARMCFFMLGAARIAGQPRSLIFFLEPENRHLLDLALREHAPRNDGTQTAGALRQQRRFVKDFLLGLLGLTIALFIKLNHPLPARLSGLSPGMPSWLGLLHSFEDHHARLIAASAIAFVAVLVKAKRLSSFERGIASMLIGVAAAAFFS